MFKIIIVSMIFLTGSILLADTQQEIDHLLDFVEKTSCKYERNGNVHTGIEAKEFC
jgi:hypothetical protein